MAVDTARPVREIQRISRATDARDIAHSANAALLALLEELEPDEWSAPTECPGWDVAAMVGHLIGAAKAGASLRESLRQQRWARRYAEEFDGNRLDAVNELQVREHAGLSPHERIAALRGVAATAVRGRLRLPRPLRWIRVRLDAGGSTPSGMPDRLSLGELMDVVYTRDVWLHRLDIARATGRSPELDGAADRRIVEDVVREWAARHGQPFLLTLSGPAGGVFRQGSGGPQLELDPIDLARMLSGRAPGQGLLAARVVF